MKRCPTCERTYSDESISYCLVDGSTLSASYDPNATIKFKKSNLDKDSQTDYSSPAPPAFSFSAYKGDSPEESRHNKRWLIWIVSGFLSLFIIVATIAMINNYLSRKPDTTIPDYKQAISDYKIERDIEEEIGITPSLGVCNQVKVVAVDGVVYVYGNCWVSSQEHKDKLNTIIANLGKYEKELKSVVNKVQYRY